MGEMRCCARAEAWAIPRPKIDSDTVLSVYQTPVIDNQTWRASELDIIDNHLLRAQAGRNGT